MRIFFAMLLSLPLFAQAEVGFEDGKQYFVDSYEGSVTVTCENRNSGPERRSRRVTRYFRCDREYISPSIFSYFNGPTGGGEKVKLTATWENGKVVEKSYRYSNKRGRTNDKVNLFARTLLQNPLLSLGDTDVSWEMVEDDKVLSYGNFQTTVNRGKRVVCKHEYMHTWYDTDLCDWPDRACDEYFRQARSCEEN